MKGHALLQKADSFYKSRLFTWKCIFVLKRFDAPKVKVCYKISSFLTFDSLQQCASGFPKRAKTAGPLFMGVWRGFYLALYTIKCLKESPYVRLDQLKNNSRKLLIAFLEFHESLHNCHCMSFGSAAAGRSCSPINRDNWLRNCIYSHHSLFCAQRSVYPGLESCSWSYNLHIHLL